MSSHRYRQKGYNVMWPWEIEVWRLGDPVPEWLSDEAEVSWISGSGEKSLKITETNIGGYEIKAAGLRQEALVRVPSKSCYVYISSSTPIPSIFRAASSPPPLSFHPRISFISPELLKILYEEVKE